MSKLTIEVDEESYESSHPNTNVDLMQKYQPELYIAPNTFNYPEQMHHYNYQHFNYPTSNTYGEYRPYTSYHSELFSPNGAQTVKRADRFDPSMQYLPPQTPDLSNNYCCCRSKRQCLKISTVVVVLCAVCLGLILFFVWPRVPVFDVSEIYARRISYSSSNSYNDPLLALQTASVAQPFKASLELSAPVTVNSSNYIDISVNSILISAKIMNSAGVNVEFLDGRGEMLNMVIPKLKSTVLYFVIKCINRSPLQYMLL
jgi:hypothetical protein